MTLEMKSLQEVILFAFKRSGKSVMTFGEITSICGLAAPNLPGFHYEDSLPGRKYFVREVIRNIRQLSDVYGLIAVNWIVNGKKIDRISLTQRGRLYLPEINFTHQERADQRTTRPVSGLPSPQASFSLT